MAFCHLHVHSEYSLLDGANPIEPLVVRAKQLGQPALALTDHGNLLGAFEFHRACVKHGVHPVIGCEVYVAPGSRKSRERVADGKRNRHLLLLARNQTGYRNLMALVSAGYLEGFYYNPRVDKELLRAHAEGLICCTACLSGEVPLQILERNLDGARESVREFQEMFGEDNVYLEVMANPLPQQRLVNETLLEFSRTLSAPLIATADCHYLTAEHHAMQDVLLSIQTGSKLSDSGRFRMELNAFWLKSEAEMRSELPAFGEAIERTVAVARRCQADPVNREKKYFAPAFALPADRPGLSEAEYLSELVWAGIAERYPQLTPAIRQRVEFELDVIVRMGYAGYFLIVWDFIRFARERGIGVGPGRGSAAGSIVAYALRIVDVDPLRFDLLFERFLNPERVSMPDIDIDFDDRRRHEVIEYVTARYGRDCVAMIATISRIKAKAAIRDVGRVLDIPLAEVNRIAALIPGGPKVALEETLAAVPELAAYRARGGAMERLFDLALKIEGIGRQVGVHAAGVVIGDRPLVELVPLLKTKEGDVATQFTMDALEELGLLKMDFLGLKNLSLIEDTLSALAEQGIRVDWAALDYYDDKAYELLRKGQTDGVFQLESDGMKRLLRELKPTCFDDIIAVLALYRPGPLNSGYVKRYVDAKHGRQRVTYPDPRLEPILRETYGVMVYQEQVMRIANVLANFTLAQADTLRKAMGKKKPDVMAKMCSQFVEGCVANGVRRKVAEELFADIAKFAEYCFNKSHSAAYAVLTFQTAYLKANYPKEFMAALLTSSMADTESLLKHIRDAEALGMRILPPDINQSGTRFTPVREGIRYGLAGVKGVGTQVIERIIEARKAGGPFASAEEFCARVGAGLLNSKLLECLVRAGAFDSWGLRRSQLLDLFPRALDVTANEERTRQLYGGGLFGDMAASTSPALAVPDIPELPFAELLRHEKQLLSIYVSGHPADAAREEIALVASHTLDQLPRLKNRAAVIVGGVLSEFKKRRFPSGESRGDALLEDGRGACPLFIPQDTLERCGAACQNLALVVVEGVLERRDDAFSLRARAVWPTAEIRQRLIRAMVLDLPAHTDPALLPRVRQAVERHPGGARLYFRVAGNGDAPLLVRAGERYAVVPTRELLAQLRDILGQLNVRFSLHQSLHGWNSDAALSPAEAADSPAEHRCAGALLFDLADQPGASVSASA